jgi:hypothetical protein
VTFLPNFLSALSKSPVTSTFAIPGEFTLLSRAKAIQIIESFLHLYHKGRRFAGFHIRLERAPDRDAYPHAVRPRFQVQ